MNKKLIILTSLMFLMSASFVMSAVYHGSFDVDVGSGSVVINPDSCEEDWTSSFWSDCEENEQMFICFDKNNCGTTVLKPALCGEIQACEVPSSSSSSGSSSSSSGSSGGSSGGGSSSSSSSSSSGGNTQLLSNSESSKCVERWKCTDWSNLENECGERMCEDINSCGTNQFKPITSINCFTNNSSGITGAIIGGFQKLSKSKTGMSLLFVLIILGLFALFNLFKKKAEKIASE